MSAFKKDLEIPYYFTFNSYRIDNYLYT